MKKNPGRRQRRRAAKVGTIDLRLKRATAHAIQRGRLLEQIKLD